MPDTPTASGPSTEPADLSVPAPATSTDTGGGSNQTPPAPAWNLAVLDQPRIVRVPARPATRATDPAVTRAAAALAAQTAGDPAAGELIRQLAHTGVVAIRTGRTTYVCRETVTTWVLLPARRRVTTRTLAKAAATRAHRLAALRQRTTATPGIDDANAETRAEPADPDPPPGRSPVGYDPATTASVPGTGKEKRPGPGSPPAVPDGAGSARHHRSTAAGATDAGPTEPLSEAATRRR